MIRACSRLSLSLLAALVIASAPAFGASIYSGNFSMGFGYVGTSASAYTTDETSGANTPDPSPGLFDFTYAFANRNAAIPGNYNGGASGDGPTFDGRVLGDGSSTEYSGFSSNFQFTIDADYLGSLPANAIPGTAQLRLHITSMSISATAYTGYSPDNQTDLRFTETTLLNPGSSTPVNLSFTPGGAPFRVAGNYLPVTWNPGEFSELGFSSSRTFVLDTAGAPYIIASGSSRLIDGFEIEGFAEVTFETPPVPEPSSWLLLSGAAVGLAWGAQRKQRTGK